MSTMSNLLYTHPWVIMVILVWSLPWKGAALWKSARKTHIGWFIVLLIVNTLGVLEILYIFFFSERGKRQEIVETQDFPSPRQMRRYNPKVIM